jgi:prepilin-type N-terminal cleavage/methylation domain-containing protein
MNVPQKSKQNGFTIIEVVLVLAIAALIFLMVFIALPALQRNQRDTQRKNDVNRAATAITNYTSNNRGALPAADKWTAFTDDYLKGDGDQFADPSAGDYVLTPLAAGTAPADPTTDVERAMMYYTTGATCGADGLAESGKGARKVAFRLKLEGAGYVCSSN